MPVPSVASLTVHRRRQIGVMPVVLALVVLLMGPGSVRAGAPVAATPDGVTIVSVGSSPVTGSAGQDLVLLRITLAPGAVVPTHRHPGDAVLMVESGVLGYTALLGGARATWGRAEEATTASDVAPGADVLLYAGDWLREPRGTVQRLRNAGPTPVILLASALVPTEALFIEPWLSQTHHQPRP